MRYIFLDIDGVLNNQAFLLASDKNATLTIDENAVKTLGKICRKLKAKVVISSAWRVGWHNGGPRTTRLRELFAKYKIEVVGLTATDYQYTRSEQIIMYVCNHFGCSDSWVAIDDEELQLSSRRFVKTDFYGDGLTMKHYKAIRDALKYTIKEEWTTN